MAQQAQNAGPKFPIWFDVREPVESFTGRIEQLEKLHSALKSKGETAISQKASVSGLGGVGKSELSRMYAKKHSEYYEHNVVWINAESHQTLKDSFHKLAEFKLGIKMTNFEGKGREIGSIVDEVYEFFSRRKSLFIFDNAEKQRSEHYGDNGIDKFLPFNLPPFFKKPNILITSRNLNWGEVEVVQLDIFTENEAMEFIKKALNIQDGSQEDDVRNLANTLQYFPLALQQAVAYINVKDRSLRNLSSKFDMRNYLKHFAAMTKDLLDFPFPESSTDPYTKTTFTTWKMTIDKIRNNANCGKEATEILEIMAYFSPDDIPPEMFWSLFSDEKIADAVDLLKQYSMVKDGFLQNLINIHRLVQEVIRLELRQSSNEEQTLRKALTLINNIGEESIIHYTSIWRYTHRYPQLTDEFCFNSKYTTHKYTPLHLLAQNGSHEEIKTILANLHSDKLIAVVNAVDWLGNTPLHFAVLLNNMDLVKYLIDEKKADCNVHNCIGQTPLHFAFRCDNLDIVKYLVDEKKVDFTIKDGIGDTLLHLASHSGNLPLARFLVDEKNFDLSAQNKDGETSLHYAAGNCNLELLKLLTDEKRMDVNVKDNHGDTPLHAAVRSGNLEMIRFLIDEKNAVVNAKNNIGHTPLDCATISGKTDLVKCLEDKEVTLSQQVEDEEFSPSHSKKRKMS